MGFKKFFYSIDLRNNKIINAKTETPTENKHIVPKDYVDNITKYDTEKASTYNNPFKFNWITSVANKTFKEIFDDLFFPRVLPIYNNPTITNISIYCADVKSSLNIGNIEKPIIFYDCQTNKIVIKIDISDSDRTANNDGQIKILNQVDDSEYFIISPIFVTNDVLFFELDLVLIKNLKFIFERNYDAITEIKTDSYGDEYIADEYTTPYKLEVDITEVVNEKILFYDSILISKDLLTTQIVPNYLVEDIDTLFDKKDNFLLNQNNYGIVDILIPLNLFYLTGLDPQIIIGPNFSKKIDIFCEIGNDNFKTLTQLDSNWLINITEEEQIIYNSIGYVKCQYNFGIYTETVNVKLLFGGVLNTIIK